MDEKVNIIKEAYEQLKELQYMNFLMHKNFNDYVSFFDVSLKMDELEKIIEENSN